MAMDKEEKVVGLSDVRYKLGMVYYRRGELSNAIRVWERALRADPEHAHAQEMIAQAMAEQRVEKEEEDGDG